MGVAAIALSKGASSIHQDICQYTVLKREYVETE